MFHRALTIREKVLAVDHADIGVSLNHLGMVMLAQGRFSEAEPLFKRALTIQERALGFEHINLRCRTQQPG